MTPSLRMKFSRFSKPLMQTRFFLPVRQTKSPEATARSRAFKEAMRQRIREVAAARQIPDDEIKPTLRLKHQEIDRFCEAHGVNLAWLIEGVGEMLKRSPKLAVDHGKEVQR